MTTSTVSEKGQVTIPKALRDKLGIKPGTSLEWQAVKGKIVLSKQVLTDDLVRKWRARSTGIVEKMGGVDAYLRFTRGH